MSRRRGFGWLPDDPTIVNHEMVHRPLGELVGAAPSPLAIRSVDFTPFMLDIPDQGATSSCVGQAFATSLFLRAAVTGISIPRPSAKLIYDFARAEDQPYVKLVDAGSRPLAAIRCLVDKGMVAESAWPILEGPDGSTNINVRPLLDIYQDALGFVVGDYYRIPAGRGASDGIRHALALGHVPVFAMPVDETYEHWGTGKVYEGRRGASLGGHMQSTGGYGDGFISVVSSWGIGHGYRGIVKIANDYFDSGEVTDIIVATLVPALTA